MNHLLLWILGFGTLWVGIKVFDDEAIFVVTALCGSALVLAGLIAAPSSWQIAIEGVLVIALFSACMHCINRGHRQ
jgi:hypothetical protein